MSVLPHEISEAAESHKCDTEIPIIQHRECLVDTPAMNDQQSKFMDIEQNEKLSQEKDNPLSGFEDLSF